MLTSNESIHSTYFKPTVWEQTGRAIRLEFAYGTQQDIGRYSSPTEKASALISYLNGDYITPTVLEATSQYLADVDAKGVSNILRALRNRLVSELDPETARYFLPRYRTN